MKIKLLALILILIQTSCIPITCWRKEQLINYIEDIYISNDNISIVYNRILKNGILLMELYSFDKNENTFKYISTIEEKKIEIPIKFGFGNGVFEQKLFYFESNYYYFNGNDIIEINKNGNKTKFTIKETYNKITSIFQINNSQNFIINFEYGGSKLFNSKDKKLITISNKNSEQSFYQIYPIKNSTKVLYMYDKVLEFQKKEIYYNLSDIDYTTGNLINIDLVKTLTNNSINVYSIIFKDNKYFYLQEDAKIFYFDNELKKNILEEGLDGLVDIPEGVLEVMIRSQYVSKYGVFFEKNNNEIIDNINKNAYNLPKGELVSVENCAY